MKKIKKALIVLIILTATNTNATPYYWVGGSGNWSDINHWSNASGGPANQSVVPSPLDNVFFDLNSGLTAGSKTITLNVTATCHNISFIGLPNNTLLLSSMALQVYGSFLLDPNLIYNVDYTEFKSTAIGNTINTSGVGINGQILFNGTGGEWKLTNNLTISNTTSAVLLNSGTFNTNNYNVTLNCFSSGQISCMLGGPSTATLILSTSTINCSGNWNFNYGGLTLDAGTSQINFTSTNSITPQQFNATPSHTYHNVSFLSAISPSVTINTVSFNNVLFTKGVKTSGSATFNDLTLAPGYRYIFQQGSTQKINGLLSSNAPSCIGLSEILTDNSNGFCNFIFNAGSSANIQNTLIRDIHATGPITPITTTLSFNLGNNTGFNFPAVTPQTIHWINGGGNWNNPFHWSTGCIPTPIDNVVFDATSGFSAGDTVFLDGVGHHCHNMDWNGASPAAIKGKSENALFIYGSLKLQSGMYFGVRSLWFKSNAIGKTITSNGVEIKGNVYFDGSGSWSFQDNFWVISTLGTFAKLGTLNTNNFEFKTGYFSTGIENGQSVILPNTFNLNLGSSIIKCNMTGNIPNDLQGWCFKGTGANLNAGTSHINFSNYASRFAPQTSHVYYNFTANASCYDIRLVNTTFHRAHFMYNALIYGAAKYDTLIFNSSNDYQFEGANNTHTILAAFIATSTPCTSFSKFSTQIIGVADNFYFGNSATANISRAMIQDFNAIGAITPITLSNCFDLGNNTGLIFSAVPTNTLYWIGGTGSWQQQFHWSYISGGAPANCIPSPADDVVFDVNSGFTPTNKTVYIMTGLKTCHSMFWIGASNTPSVVLNGGLDIFGSLTLQNAMTFSTIGYAIVNFRSSNNETIKTNGAIMSNGIVFNGNGSWTLLDDLALDNLATNSFQNGLGLNKGTLNTNNKNVSVASLYRGAYFNAGAPVSTCSLNLGSSKITIFGNVLNSSGWRYIGANAYLNAGTSVITFSNNNNAGMSFWSKAGHNYSKLFFTTPAITASGGAFARSAIFLENGILRENDDFDTLVFNSGKTYVLGQSSVHTVNQQFYTSGSPCFITFIKAESIPYPPVLKVLAGNVNYDYVSADHIVSSGGLTLNAGGHSTNLGGNINWFFAPPSSLPITGLGNDTIVCSNTLPYTLSTAGFYPNPFTLFTWQGNVITPTYTINTPGTYSVLVSYANNCNVKDSIVISVATTPSISSSSFSNITCFGLNNGSASIIISGGLGPYTYSWSPSTSSTSYSVNGLAQGNYTSTIIDANYCIKTTTFLIIQPAQLTSTLSSSIINLPCFGINTDTVVASVSGGTGAYTYTWSNNTYTNSVNNLTGGSYSVTIQDSNQCTITQTLSVLQPTSSISIQIDNIASIACLGQSTGSITTTISGGTPNYTYNWQPNNSSNSNLVDITSGVYTLTVNDANGCKADTTLTVQELASTSVTIAITNTLSPYCNVGNGLIEVDCHGGVAPYTYNWAPINSTNQNLNNIYAGTYSVIVTDSVYCKTSTSITLDCIIVLNVPQIYTPNADGINDKFEIIGIEAYPYNTVNIFNRWGNLVYSKIGYKNEWSGKSIDGKLLPASTYYVTIDFGDTNIKPYNGFVELKY